MKTDTYTFSTRVAGVRRGYTQECDWRDALGGAEPLRVAVIDGPMDAPEWLPAGSTRAARGSCIPEQSRMFPRESTAV